MPAIELEHVHFSYEENEILRNLSLKVEKGEFIGIIGPNGGGKTTLLKLLMGLLKPRSGMLKVLGRPPKTIRQQIAYVPQVLRFDRHFPISLKELVLGGCMSRLPWFGRFSQADEEKALACIDKMGLSALQDRLFGTLSGGQAQRALIARALASSPQILLLDEPTASVDAEAEAKIYAILKSLYREITILMVTHDLKAIMHEVDRVFCIQREATVLRKEEVCTHFALGLYHPPIKNLL